MNNQSRQRVVLAGKPHWQKEQLVQQFSEYASKLLWVGEDVAAQFRSVSLNKAHHWLGSEQQVVVFDANQHLDVDALAAISGVIVGGGMLVLLMPPVEQWQSVYATRFGQRFLRSLGEQSWLVIEEEGVSNLLSPIKNKHVTVASMCCELTADQDQALAEISQQLTADKPLPVVLVSDRGRGKSAILGIAAAKLLASNTTNKILVTAPRLAATDVLFKHAAGKLRQAEQQRGQLSLADQDIEFHAPDELIEQQPQADLLIVDEAAAIPVPLLTKLLQRYPRVVFATTVHGYEGTGRGFALRFQKILNQHSPGWKKLQLQIPVRWGENDSLEQWLFHLLCLDADIASEKVFGDFKLDDLVVEEIDRDQLHAEEDRLREMFALLVLAHYRTRPSDLVRLLDDEAITLYVASYQQHVVAVSMVTREGSFAKDLAEAVYRGERRPKGHLLAQTLEYHCAVKGAAQADFARIMRIAVHPALQRHGIGQQLLQTIISNEQRKGRDGIGASFGVTAELLKFWRVNNFTLARIGFTREQSSGEQAAVMLQGLSPTGKAILQQARAQFQQNLPFWLHDVLKLLAAEVKTLLQSEQLHVDKSYSKDDEVQVKLFLTTSRAYELCIAPISKLVATRAAKIEQAEFPGNYRQILQLRVEQRLTWNEVVARMQLMGKAQAQQLLRDAVQQLI